MHEREGQARYWRFFWPLALTGSIGLIGAPLKNYFLLEYPDGVRELAVFALAWSVFMPLQSAMWMVPQAISVLVVDRGSLKKSTAFFGGVALVMTGLLLVLGFTEGGTWTLRQVYDLDQEGLAKIQEYLRWFAPLPVLMTAGQFLQGMLVRAEATGRTTAVEVVRMVGMGGLLWLGLRLQWDPMKAIIVSQLAADGLAIALRGGFLWPLRRRWAAAGQSETSYRGIAGFFLPIAFTTLMFSLGRPIVFGFVTKVDPASFGPGMTMEMAVAGLNLAWSLAPLLVNPLNQFRSVFVNFAKVDLAGVALLLRRVVAFVVVLWVLVSWTGAVHWFFRAFQGADAEVARVGELAFRALVGLPLFMGWRNYYHGLGLTYKRTRSMGVAAVARVGAIYASCWLAFSLGLLGPVGAALCFCSGFMVETLMSIWGTRGLREELKGGRLRD